MVLNDIWRNKFHMFSMFFRIYHVDPQVLAALTPLEHRKSVGGVWHTVGGGFKYVLLLCIPGEMIQFDGHIFSNGLKPPTSIG